MIDRLFHSYFVYLSVVNSFVAQFGRKDDGTVWQTMVVVCLLTAVQVSLSVCMGSHCPVIVVSWWGSNCTETTLFVGWQEGL